MCPTEPLRQQGVGEPASKGSCEAISFGGHERAGQHADHSDARGKLSKIVRQVADCVVVSAETEVIQHGVDAGLRQQFLGRRAGQPAPSQQHRSGGTDGQKIARACEQHGVAQRAFVLDSAGLLYRCRRRSKREALPPGAGPPLLPADHRVERADGRTSNECDILNVFVRKIFHIGDGTAQPTRYRRHRRGHRGAGKSAVVA